MRGNYLFPFTVAKCMGALLLHSSVGYQPPIQALLQEVTT